MFSAVCNFPFLAVIILIQFHKGCKDSSNLSSSQGNNFSCSQIIQSNNLLHSNALLLRHKILDIEL